MSLPMSGWMPAADDHIRPNGPAHYVPPGCQVVLDPAGIAYLALCGAHCAPFLRDDDAYQAMQRSRCPACEVHAPS